MADARGAPANSRCNLSLERATGVLQACARFFQGRWRRLFTNITWAPSTKVSHDPAAGDRCVSG
jgi:hypothetical protein